MRLRTILPTLAVTGLCACSALSKGRVDQIVTVAFEDNRVEMRDARDGSPIMMPRWIPLYEGRAGVTLDPSDMRFTPHPDGFDIEFIFHNNTGSEKMLSDIVLNTFTLGPVGHWRDFRWMGEAGEITLARPPAFSHSYPGDLYSPVALLGNDQHAVGISVIYPLFEYKHDVAIAPRTRGGRAGEGEGGQGWHVRLLFSDIDGRRADFIRESAVLAPGERRSYLVAVRVTRDPDDWMRTLVPYRDHFRQTYGGVRYERRTDPVRAMVIAEGSSISADNPDGWARAWAGMRPDQRGFEPWVNDILTDRSFNRSMLWAPSGMYNRNRDNNYPFQFASRWLQNPQLATALDERVGFPRVARAGKELGLWWGHSGWYADRWDPVSMERFDPNDPVHVQAAFNELDTAYRAGARAIGLDAFSHRAIRTWDAYDWLGRLMERYPDMTFVIEPKTCDILHALTPMYINGYRMPQTARTYDDVFNVHSPHYLADLLNPGHETWAALRWDMYPRYFGARAPTARIHDDIRRAANFGFVPLIFWQVSFEQRPVAAESWLYSVPEDLRLPPADPIDPRGLIGSSDGGRDGRGGNSRDNPANRTDPVVTNDPDRQVVGLIPNPGVRAFAPPQGTAPPSSAVSAPTESSTEPASATFRMLGATVIQVGESITQIVSGPAAVGGDEASPAIRYVYRRGAQVRTPAATPHRNRGAQQPQTGRRQLRAR